MNRKGIHLFNVPSPSALDQLWAIGADSYVVLDQQRNWIPEIRRHNPSAKIVVRVYKENWTLVDPVVLAHEVAGWWGRDCAPYGPEIYLTPANEQNLADEGYAYPGLYPPKACYEKIRDWNIAFARAIKETFRGTSLPPPKLIFPALSWGHSDDQADAGYVGNDIIAPAVKEFDNRMGVHCYWNNASNRKSRFVGRRYEITHAAHPEWELWCTEAGANESLAADDAEDYKAWLDELPDYMVEHFSPALFIWQGAGAMDGWSIDRKLRIAQMLRDYKAPPNPPFMPTREKLLAIAQSQYPDNDVRAVGVVAMCREAGIPDPTLAAAIILAESDGSSWALHQNASGSWDVGIGQENDKYQGLRSEDDYRYVLNPAGGIKEVRRIRRQWGGWNAYSTFKRGVHLRRVNPSPANPNGLSPMERAQIAAAQLDALKGGQ